MVPRNLYRTDQIIRRNRRKAKKRCYLFIWQDCQPYPVDAESAKSEDRTYTRAYYMCMIIRSEGRERANGDGNRSGTGRRTVTWTWTGMEVVAGTGTGTGTETGAGTETGSGVKTGTGTRTDRGRGRKESSPIHYILKETE